jgi:D-glycero-alpha-D-manno-heptose-7-phosphate kinase
MHALRERAGQVSSPAELAAEACTVEIERVKEPIGKQDQYAAAFGGLNFVQFREDESVEVRPVAIPPSAKEELSKRRMLFYIGQERQASSILSEQSRNMRSEDKFSRVQRMVRNAEELCSALERGEIETFGEILHEGWLLKSGVASGITNEVVETNYRLAREAGAEGGKLLGAGGGGFLLVYCRLEKQERVRSALAHLREMSFAMTQEGSKVLCNDGHNGRILPLSRPVSVSAK